MLFERLDQVAYVPLHAKDDLDHPDVEYGFVTNDPMRNFVYVRYWVRGEEGRRLRTLANSEATRRDCLHRRNSATLNEVLRIWEQIKHQYE